MQTVQQTGIIIVYFTFYHLYVTQTQLLPPPLELPPPIFEGTESSRPLIFRSTATASVGRLEVGSHFRSEYPPPPG